jgi:hypothetical protein
MSYFYFNSEGPVPPPPLPPAGTSPSCPAGNINTPLLYTEPVTQTNDSHRTAISILQGVLAGASVYTILELTRYFLFG